MGTDGVGAVEAITLAEIAKEWQMARKGRKTTKKPKRAAMALPMVEQTPPQRRERSEREGGGAAPEGGAAAGAASANAADQTQGSTEVALRRALNVLEMAREVFEEVLALDVGGMTSGLRARVSESRDAMQTLCAGMALQRLRTASMENKRAAQDLARARKDLEKEKKGMQRPAPGRHGRS